MILQHLGECSGGLSNTELAEKLGVDKATASRLAATLARYGYIERDEPSRCYMLGPQIITLGRKAVGRLSLVDTARPFLNQLMEQTGECAHLAIQAQGRALYIAQVESPATLRVNAQVGTMNPLHCTALGKILLAYGAAEISTALEAYTENTITGPDQLKTHLEAVRQAGYAVDDEEFDPGVRCIAAPVFSQPGRAAAAIGVSGPSSRITLESIPALQKIVTSISEQISARLSLPG